MAKTVKLRGENLLLIKSKPKEVIYPVTSIKQVVSVDDPEKSLEEILEGKSDKTIIIDNTSESIIDITLQTNTIYNWGELSQLTLTLPSTVPIDFIVQVEFSSGTTATEITSSVGIYFDGDACEDGVFTPEASHRYMVLITSDGVNTIGFVYEK